MSLPLNLVTGVIPTTLAAMAVIFVKSPSLVSLRQKCILSKRAVQNVPVKNWMALSNLLVSRYTLFHKNLTPYSLLIC